MKKRKKTIISLVLCMLFAFAFSVANVKADTVQTGNWTRYQNSEANNGVTDYPGPTDENHAISRWNVLADSSYATTPPLIVNDKIYVASGYHVYCFDKSTGNLLGKSDELVGSAGNALHPMVYAEGKLFVITSKNGARIEALNLNDPENPRVEWSSSAVSGTSYSPLSYHYNQQEKEGYLYTGTWNGDQKGTYFCVSAKDGRTVWTFEDENGFYWDGAYATDNYVAFASENEVGGDNIAEGSALYTVDHEGVVIDSVTGLKGSIRNTVVFDSGYLYVGTVAGRLYRIKVDEYGNLGQYSGTNNDDFSFIDLDGRIKATILVRNNRLYVGVEGNTTGSSFYQVIDCSGPLGYSSKIGRVSVEDEPKGAPILSTAEDGTDYIYFTCNQTEGGIYYFTDSNGSLSESKCLYEPEYSQQQRCISSFALDTDGTIYYTNDSKYLMAVAPKLIQDVEVTPLSGVQWDNQRFEAGVKNYNLTVTDSVSSLQFNVKKIDGDTDVSWKFIVDGNEQESNTVTLDRETTKVELQVTRKAITQSYHFNIYKVTPQNTSLSLLYYGTDLYSGDNLLPSIEAGKTEYSVDLRKTAVGEVCLWIKTLHSNASIRVYAVENVKDPYTDKELKSDQELDPIFIETGGEYKFAVNPVDNSKNTVIRVSITSKDESKTQDYQVCFVRTDATQNVAPQPGVQQPSGTTVSNQPAAQTSTNVNIPKPKKVSGLKSKKSKKKVTLSWKKVSGASGYQIILAKDKKFKKSKKQINISKASTCKKQIKLTAKTKYVRVRAYVKKNGTTVYGAYSKTLKIN